MQKTPRDLSQGVFVRFTYHAVNIQAAVLLRILHNVQERVHTPMLSRVQDYPD